MNELPSGTVTLLFTDIEGSTRLLHELGVGYREALEEHRRAIRDAVEAHGGVEIDTQGDAFFVAFSGAREAVAAAQEAQQALAPGSIRVRMGLHTGEPEPTETGYVGWMSIEQRGSPARDTAARCFFLRQPATCSASNSPCATSGLIG